MGGVPIKHHTHGKTGRRRSHLAMKKQALVVCPNCGSPKTAHRACPQCGKQIAHVRRTAPKATPAPKAPRKTRVKKQ